MARFEVDGKVFHTENFSNNQKHLISYLSVTKNLISELKIKNDLFLGELKSLEKSWKRKFGSKIKEISKKESDTQITLANGKKLELSKLKEDEVTYIQNLSFLNEQILYFENQLQVLDTARLEYSKKFYETVKVAE